MGYSWLVRVLATESTDSRCICGAELAIISYVEDSAIYHLFSSLSVHRGGSF